MGTEKHSKASRLRWANVSKEQRSKRMSNLALKKWAKISKRKRREHALMMVSARQKHTGNADSAAN